MRVVISNKNKKYIVLCIVMVALLITAAAAVTGWYLLDTTSLKLKTTAEEFQKKTELVITLLDTSRSRTIALQAMLIEQDPFAREEAYNSHLESGSRFLAARAKLEAMNLDATENRLIAEFDDIINRTGPDQQHFIQLALSDQLEQARQLMKGSSYINVRMEMFAKFDEMLTYYRNKTNKSLDAINTIFLEDIRFILILSTFVLLASTSVGYFMLRKVARTEKMLGMEVTRRVAAQKELENNSRLLESRVKQEINKYKETEAARNESQEIATTFGKIMEDSLNEIYIFDATSLRYIEVNKSARENLGYTTHELNQLTPLEIKSEMTEEDFRSNLNAIDNGTEKVVTFTTRHTRKDGTSYPVEVHLQKSTMGLKPVYIAIILDLTNREAAQNKLRLKNEEIEQANNELKHQKQALDEHAIVSVVCKDETLQSVNAKFTEISQFTEDELIGGHFCIGMSDDQPEEFFVELSSVIQSGEKWHGVIGSNRKDGTPYWTNTTITPFTNSDGVIYKFVVISTDFTAQKMAEKEILAKSAEIEAAHEELKATRNQALQSEKLASVGQLAAGIAHEINTPIQFVGDNTRFLQEAFEDLSGLIETYEEVCTASMNGAETETLVNKAHEQSKKIDIEYLNEEVPKAITQSLEGVDRVTKIVRSMKDFSHPGSDHKEIIDINNAIESTITVSKNEWKYEAELVTDFDVTLTAVPCFPGEFNQVVLNMIVNAAHAIKDVRGDGGDLGTISISTHRDDNFAEVRIKDSGTGMPEEVRKRIFEPFYTTKGVGKGSGQGLAIAYAVIVDKHHGTIDVESEPGNGTTFIIRIPLVEPESGQEAEYNDNSGTKYENTAYS